MVASLVVAMSTSPLTAPRRGRVQPLAKVATRVVLPGVWVNVAPAQLAPMAPCTLAVSVSVALPAVADPNAKMLVEANELVQNSNDNTVSASGNVRIYYEGRTLEADRVVYDKSDQAPRRDGPCQADREGRHRSCAARSSISPTTIRDGFVESLRADTPQQTHFSAPRVERIGGETTTFDKGTYTACDACKDHPERPVLWRVRAKRIIHKNDEQMIYYEDADLEFLGIPVAYTPYLSAPDPTVKKKSGLLTPTTVYKSQLGYGVGQPIFYNIAPDYDLTVTPTVYLGAGLLRLGRIPPALRQRHVLHPRVRHRSAQPLHVPARALRGRRQAPARRCRHQGRVPALRRMEVRLERHRHVRQVLSVRLFDPVGYSVVELLSPSRSRRST